MIYWDFHVLRYAKVVIGCSEVLRRDPVVFSGKDGFQPGILSKY